MRKYVLRRHLALSEGEIAALMTDSKETSRSGPQGGSEAQAVFFQLVFDEWASGSLNAL